MLYLYEFKNTPTRGVGPDLRLTARGIRDGTQIQLNDIANELEKLIGKALVRPVLLGNTTLYFLTMKGYCEVEKVQRRSAKLGFDQKGLNFGFEKSETKEVRI